MPSLSHFHFIKGPESNLFTYRQLPKLFRHHTPIYDPFEAEVSQLKWEKMSQEAAARLASIVKPFACQKKPMFGHEVYWVNGNMFTGVFQDSIFFRLSANDQAEFLGKYNGAKQFEPMAGRPMKDYVVVPESVLGDKKLVDEWMSRSYAFTASLPAKKAKAKK